MDDLRGYLNEMENERKRTLLQQREDEGNAAAAGL